MKSNELLLLAPSESQAYAKRVADVLGIALSGVEETDFEDGENKISPAADVRDQDVILIQSLYSESRLSVEEKVCRLLFLASGLRDAGAARLTAILPYLAFSRQDKRSAPNEPLTNRYLANLLEASGVARVVTVDVHNPSAFQNAYRCQALNLESISLFVDHFEPLARAEEVTVVSPDAGGMRRAKALAQALGARVRREIPIAVVDKTRLPQGVVAHQLLGEVKGKAAIIYDDMISTGSTMHHALRLCMEGGARYGVAAATHGLFFGKAISYLGASEFKSVVCTDTVERLEMPLIRLQSAPLVAEVLKKAR